MIKGKIKIVGIALMLAGLLYAGWRVYYGVYFSNIDNSIITKVHWIESSCGDCPVTWRVDSVLNNNSKSYSYLVGKDMPVFYKSQALEDQIGHEANWNCIVCSGIQIKGKVKKTLSGKFKFIADSYKYDYISTQECCPENK